MVNDGTKVSVELARRLPKIDLHSHLSGSISQAKLNELLVGREKKPFEIFDAIQDFGSPEEANKKCFEYFDAVSAVVTDLATLKECTRQVFEMFANENCIYLELRTEPKAFIVGDSTPEQYLEIIQECIDELNRKMNRMEVRVCLSIKRDGVHTKTVTSVVKKIDDMVAIAKKFENLVVGIDICGNPAHDTIISKILPALIERKDCFRDLPITFHIGEMDNDDECDAIIGQIEHMNIRRLGHAINLKESHIEKVRAIAKTGYSLGIEVCPTSNLVAGQMKGLCDHHFGRWWKRCSKDLLFSINTDDRGLFSCDLTGEVYNLSKCFGLNLKDLCDIQKQAVRSSFHPDKDRFLEIVDRFYIENCNINNDYAISDT